MPLSNPMVRTAPTYIVAAYNSSDAGRADFVCPEVDSLDFITTEVIPELPTSGGSIAFLEGTYYCSTFRKPLKIDSLSEVSLLGQGGSTVFALSNGVQSNLIHVVNSDHIFIDGLYIDGTTTSDEDGSLPNQTQNGVFLDVCKKSVISNCVSTENKGYGINLYIGSTNNKVVNCVCSSNGHHGILAALDATENIITSNRCVDNTENGIRVEADADRCIIADNTVTNNSLFGIYVHRADSVVVSGNSLYGNTQHGIILEESDYSSIIGNTCQQNQYNGICLNNSDYNTITGNSCRAAPSYNGIYVYQSSGNVVSSNSCLENTRYGILVTDVSNRNLIANNSCIDNDFNNTNTYDGIGIDNDSDYNHVTGNLCYVTVAGTNQRYGINITNANCDGTFVIGNDLYQAGRTGDYNDAGTGTIYHSNRTTVGWVA